MFYNYLSSFIIFIIFPHLFIDFPQIFVILTYKNQLPRGWV